MKNQHYSDSRDVSKWSVVVRLAREHLIRHVFHVAMLTEDDENRGGVTVNGPEISEDCVVKFFEREHEAFLRGEPKDIGRITGLPASCGMGFRANVFDRPFRSLDGQDFRKAYFSDAMDLIALMEEPSLVLVDPDGGMGGAKGGKRHSQIRPEELSRLFIRLRPGNGVMLFQHRQNIDSWIKVMEGRFRSAVQGPESIRAFPDGNALFLVAFKGPK